MDDLTTGGGKQAGYMQGHVYLLELKGHEGVAQLDETCGRSTCSCPQGLLVPHRLGRKCLAVRLDGLGLFQLLGKGKLVSTERHGCRHSLVKRLFVLVVACLFVTSG